MCQIPGLRQLSLTVLALFLLQPAASIDAATVTSLGTSPQEAALPRERSRQPLEKRLPSARHGRGRGRGSRASLRPSSPPSPLISYPPPSPTLSATPVVGLQWPPHLKNRCKAGGNYNPTSGVCTCPIGRGGVACEMQTLRGCRSTKASTAVQCMAKRPQHCTCLAQCFASGAFRVHLYRYCFTRADGAQLSDVAEEPASASYFQWKAGYPPR